MKKHGLELHDQKDSPEAAAILAGLQSYNDKYRTEDWRDLTVYSRRPDGTVDAGLSGHTDWGWLFVKWLWVSEPLRGTGMGSRLLAAAEEEARARGCHSAWLDTFSFQAPEFYKRLGYEIFGELADFPVGGARFFFRKKL